MADTDYLRTKQATMQRRAMADLVAWKESHRRKPLVVNGARQVGKTWLICEFGRKEFNALAHVVFLENEEAKGIFESSLDPSRLLTYIGALTGTNPRDGKTLVFLDEIQECPRAITALKLFSEQTPDIPIIAAGSLLGVALNRSAGGGETEATRVSWPVGKVNYLNLYPLTFDEFLLAAGKEQLAELLALEAPESFDVLSEQLESLLKLFLFTGGMPEVLQAYLDSGDLSAARNVQEELLLGYELDFAKHASSASAIERIRATWNSVPSQLATESNMKRFTYASIRPGARGRDYKDAVAWLADAGLVTKVRRISKPGIPLEGYADNTYFKLYMLDVGLLGAATRLNATSILGGNRAFVEYKGAYAEQFICQHLVAYGNRAPFYWSADGKKAKGEVDFVVEHSGSVFPIEVKAAKNVSGGSIARFCKAFGIPKAVRYSLQKFKKQDWLVNIPLYAVTRPDLWLN